MKKKKFKKNRKGNVMRSDREKKTVTNIKLQKGTVVHICNKIKKKEMKKILFSKRPKKWYQS